MNTFNIRELQGILKRRFFTDLINVSDHHDFLENSVINLRFRSNNTLGLMAEQHAFYTYGTTLLAKNKSNNYTNLYNVPFGKGTTNHAISTTPLTNHSLGLLGWIDGFWSSS